MASITRTASPAATLSPALTLTSTMLPGIAVVTQPSCDGRGRPLAPTFAAVFFLSFDLPPPTSISLNVSTMTSSAMPSTET